MLYRRALVAALICCGTIACSDASMPAEDHDHGGVSYTIDRAALVRGAWSSVPPGLDTPRLRFVGWAPDDPDAPMTLFARPEPALAEGALRTARQASRCSVASDIHAEIVIDRLRTGILDESLPGEEAPAGCVADDSATLWGARCSQYQLHNYSDWNLENILVVPIMWGDAASGQSGWGIGATDGEPLIIDGRRTIYRGVAMEDALAGETYVAATGPHTRRNHRTIYAWNQMYLVYADIDDDCPDPPTPDE